MNMCVYVCVSVCVHLCVSCSMRFVFSRPTRMDEHICYDDSNTNDSQQIQLRLLIVIWYVLTNYRRVYNSCYIWCIHFNGKPYIIS